MLHVSGWLLSCRTLQAGIEHAMLARVASASHLAFDWESAPRGKPAAARPSVGDG
jgi:predicted enzyme involved in methoxymalonyl-ACP biosynthesis